MKAYSITSKYNLPVFEIKPKVTDTKTYREVVLDNCEIYPNFQNVTFNNNCLRWLRRVVANKNPFFTSPPDIEFHLCSLYLKPGRYDTIEELVVQMNKSMQDAASILFSNPHTAEELKGDEYFDKWQRTDNIFSLHDGEIYFELGDVLPVSCPEKLSNSKITKVIIPNHDDIVYTKNILNRDLTITKNSYHLINYKNQNGKIDNTYFDYKQQGIEKQLGIYYAEIENPIPIYLLKCFNYSEEIYSGNIKIPSIRMKTIDTIIPESTFNYSLATYDIISSQIMTNHFYQIASYSPIIPSYIYFYETTNADVETTINTTNDNNEIYGFANDRSYFKFSSEARLTIPEDSSLYIYISNPDAPYLLANGNYKLTYSYLN